MNQEIISIKKKKWYRRKLFYIIILLALVIGGIAYGQVKMSRQKPEYEIAKVERGALKQTVDATGNVKSANELDLRFEASGRIGQIYKKTGDDVKAGDLIVDLQLEELNAATANASAIVQKAQADLNKALAGNTLDYISSLQAKYDKAAADLEQIKANSADLISNGEAARETAKNNLKLSEGGENNQIVQDAYDDMAALLNAIQDTLSDSLIKADNILGIDNKFANNEFETVLSVRDLSKITIAENKYLAAKSAKIDVDESVNSLSAASSHDKIDWAADTAYEGLLAMKELLFSVSEVLDKTFSIGDLSQSELDILKNGIQTARGNISAKYASLVDQDQAIKTAKNSYTANKIAYDKSIANLENTKNKAQADIDAYHALVGQAKANLDDAMNPPREVDVASYRAAVSAAEASLSQAAANRNKARIKAPLEGVIGKIDAKTGEYVSSQDSIVKLVSPHYEIIVDIPETDIIKISLNNSATVRLDAFGDDVEFVGKVIEIEQGETIIQDVVYYTVTLSMEEDKEHEILNGMTANVMFYTEEKADVLYIPQRAVRSDERGKYVRVLENKEVKEVLIKTGLRGDGGLVEVVEGVREGEEVVVSANGSGK
ncbi:MAG: efflux RND transporter periplasmic adaptor subunit [Patescibacteria group bacterium]